MCDAGAGDSLVSFFNKQIAPSVGAQVHSGGSIVSGCHPATATVPRMLREAFMPNPPRDTSSAYAARALVWRCFSDNQRKAIKTKVTDLQTHGSPLCLISQRFDETGMYLALSAADSVIYYKWLLEALDAEKNLSHEDKVHFAEALATEPRFGTVKVMVCRSFFCWGLGDDQQARILAAPVAVQRTTASNTREALRSMLPHELRAAWLISQVAAFVMILWFHFSSDSAASNHRLSLEEKLKYRHVPNVCLSWSWCGGHFAGITVEDLLKGCRVLDVLFSLSKVLRNVDCVHDWKAGIAISVQRTHHILTTSTHDAEAARSQSDPIVDRICRMTVFRELRVQPVYHPNSPRPVPMAAAWREKYNLVEEFKVYWQLGFGTRETRHVCDRTQALCECPKPSADPENLGRHARFAQVASVSSYNELWSPMIPQNNAAANRWQSFAPHLSSVTFGILVGEHAPRGWLLQHPLHRVHSMVLENDANPNCNPYTKEQTKRLWAISMELDGRDFNITVTLITAVTEPIDRMLRYILKGDASENKDLRSVPIVLEIASDEKSPFLVALRELTALFDDESDLVWLIKFWCRRELEDNIEIDPLPAECFFDKWARISCAMVFQQFGGILYRCHIPSRIPPLQLWTIPSAAVYFGNDSAQEYLFLFITA